MYGKNPRDLAIAQVNKSTLGLVSRVELGNLLDNFKMNILGNISEQINMLRV